MRHAGMFSAALSLMTGAAFAADTVWVSRLQIDDGFELQNVLVVADSEGACLAQASSYRGVVAFEPCGPIASSAIVDDNDWGRGRGRRNPGTVQPDPGSGSSSGGTAAGAGRGLGRGLGDIGGGH